MVYPEILSRYQNSYIPCIAKLLRKSIRGSRRKILTQQIHYFNKPLSTGLFNYDKIAQLNLPIGSGAVESLIRQAVNLRLLR